MRIGVLSDIHSNLAALECTFSYFDSKKVDEVFCLGDTVGYGPFPNECIEILRSRKTTVIAGNHDWGAIKKIPLKNFNKMGQKTLRWTQKVITDVNLDFLIGLPLKIIKHNITFVHAEPNNPEQWIYIISNEDVKEAFSGFTTPVCFIGHTHIASVVNEDLVGRKLHRKTRSLINIGSVGQPRDSNPKTSFGILDINNWTYELVRLDYDIQKTIDGIKKNGLPSILARRLTYGM